MGQLVEWPEVLTEGKDLEECRTLLREGANHAICTNRTKIIPVKRHRHFDRISANELC